MKQVVLDLSSNLITGNLEIELSFAPFHAFISKKMMEPGTAKKQLYQTVLNKLEEIDNIDAAISLEEIDKYSELLELIYTSITGVTVEDNEILWAMCLPALPIIFYGTDALIDIMLNKQDNSILEYVKKETSSTQEEHFNLFYAMVLQRFYGFTFSSKLASQHYFTNPVTGLLESYRVNIDDRFFEMIPKKPLPNISLSKLERYVRVNKHTDYLFKRIPPDLFQIKGFGIINHTNVTEQYAIDRIKTSIIETAVKPKNQCVNGVKHALHTLAGTNKIDFGFIPLALINEKPLLDFGSLSNSVILNDAIPAIPPAKMMQMVKDYIKDPKPLFIKDIHRYPNAKNRWIEILRKSGCDSFALVPLLYHDKFVGIMEVSSKEKGVLDEKLLLKLDAALPYVAQLIKTTVDDFYNKIDAVVGEKFTALQPAVKWKFNEAAYRYMQNKVLQTAEPEMETISFKSVYPLYGAIDIRNSSTERNIAAREDLTFCLSLLAETFAALKNKSGLSLIDEIIFKTNKWKTGISNSLSTSEEYRLNQFIETEAIPTLKHLQKVFPDSGDLANTFFDALNVQTGAAHANRRNLESSMQLINSTINEYFERTKQTIQAAYPCYFEKIRTDGIEYDIYIGQSIAPTKPFDTIYLKNLRLWQLKSMAEIYHLVQGLQSKMSRPLNITQLIFINANTIDISFRNDEKRFDVEGGYNIRYQVIKKRIDKVHLKDSNERLTQPGKIAMVYYNQAEAEEYESYIQYLQEENILLNDLEYLELEQLQGIAGLKALRVSLNID